MNHFDQLMMKQAMRRQNDKKECGYMILTPSPQHNGGMWCAELYPCKQHGEWRERQAVAMKSAQTVQRCLCNAQGKNNFNHHTSDRCWWEAVQGSWEEKWEELRRQHSFQTMPWANAFIRKQLITARQGGYDEGRADFAEVIDGDAVRNMTRHIRAAVFKEVEKILLDELELAHTTESGKTSRITSVINRVASLQKEK